MSNYLVYNDKVAFHPGYYVQELVGESGLTQEDFAKRLGTTPKNLSRLINGQQRLSPEMAFRLARLVGTGTEYWLNLQSRYDELVMEFQADEELQEEKRILDYIGYGYLRDNFNLPDLSHKKAMQVEEARKFLKVSSLTVFENKDMAVSFRSASSRMTAKNIVNANVMVQIAVNKALSVDSPAFDMGKFQSCAEYALTLTSRHEDFYPLLRDAFRDAGVVFEVLPNLPGSKTNGATKKIGDRILLMVNDRRLYSDVFWFTLFHEIGHIMNKDYGISFEGEQGQEEELADRYAHDMLIPSIPYSVFIHKGLFGYDEIVGFASSIKRDPGIVLGRLQHDKLVDCDDVALNKLRKKYRIVTV